LIAKSLLIEGNATAITDAEKPVKNEANDAKKIIRFFEE
jgi:hypothetical protein